MFGMRGVGEFESILVKYQTIMLLNIQFAVFRI